MSPRKARVLAVAGRRRYAPRFALWRDPSMTRVGREACMTCGGAHLASLIPRSHQWVIRVAGRTSPDSTITSESLTLSGGSAALEAYITPRTTVATGWKRSGIPATDTTRRLLE